MTRTIQVDIELLEGTMCEYIERQIARIAGEMTWVGCSWVTNIMTDGKFLAIHSTSSEHYPDKLKPSKICYKVIALNDDNEDYYKLRNQKTLILETKIHDKLIDSAEIEFSKYGTIKSWNMVYIPGHIVIVASV